MKAASGARATRSRPDAIARARSPAVVREGLVGLGHAMRLFTLLDRAATVLAGVEQLGRELARHRVLAALARRLDQPTHGKGRTARRAHFDRHLVRGAADPAALDLDRRGDVGQSLLD